MGGGRKIAALFLFHPRRWIEELCASFDCVALIDDDDVTIVSAFYDNGATSGHQWYEGDFNFDGKVDDNDVTVLSALYDQSQPPLSNSYLEGHFSPSFAAAFEAGQALSATLPEPGAMGVIGWGVMGMMRRRRGKL